MGTGIPPFRIYKRESWSNNQCFQSLKTSLRIQFLPFSSVVWGLQVLFLNIFYYICTCWKFTATSANVLLSSWLYLTWEARMATSYCWPHGASLFTFMKYHGQQSPVNFQHSCRLSFDRSGIESRITLTQNVLQHPTHMLHEDLSVFSSYYRKGFHPYFSHVRVLTHGWGGKT